MEGVFFGEKRKKKKKKKKVTISLITQHTYSSISLLLHTFIVNAVEIPLLLG